jgi:hypothetical protein
MAAQTAGAWILRKAGALLSAVARIRTSRDEESQVAVFLGAFPVLPGKSDEARKLADDTMARSEEFNTSQRNGGITKEHWSLQETPAGAFVLVYFECSDVEQAFGTLGASTDDFDVWFREQVKDVSGVDLGAPPEEPPPDIILNWSA